MDFKEGITKDIEDAKLRLKGLGENMGKLDAARNKNVEEQLVCIGEIRALEKVLKDADTQASDKGE